MDMSLAKTFLAIGIAVLLAVFISYGIYVVYPAPHYGYTDTSSCYTQYSCQTLTDKCMGRLQVTYNRDGTNNTIPAEYNYTCAEQVYASVEYQKCTEDQQTCIDNLNQNSGDYVHARNSFYILIVLAIIAIVVGAFISHLEGIGSGFIGGGVLIVLWSLIYTTPYWTTLNKYLKLVAVGVVLVLLIWLGYKKLEKKLQK
jgi:hypothetical protein